MSTAGNKKIMLSQALSFISKSIEHNKMSFCGNNGLFIWIVTWNKLLESRDLLDTAGTSLLYGPFPV